MLPPRLEYHDASIESIEFFDYECINEVHNWQKWRYIQFWMLLTMYVVGFKSHDMHTNLINAIGMSGLMQDQFNLRSQLFKLGNNTLPLFDNILISMAQIILVDTKASRMCIDSNRISPNWMS